MPKQTEQQLTKSIIDYLNSVGVLAFRNNTGAIKKGSRFIRYGLGVGSPDIVGILPGGRFLALEVKLPGGKVKVTDSQADWLSKAGTYGARAAVVTSLLDVANIVRYSAAVGA